MRDIGTAGQEAETAAMGHQHTAPFVRTAALLGNTNLLGNWTTTSAPVLPRQAVARCERCGGRVVGRFESDYSCINCGRYPLDYGADPERPMFEGRPGSGGGRQFSGAAKGPRR